MLLLGNPEIKEIIKYENDLPASPNLKFLIFMYQYFHKLLWFLGYFEMMAWIKSEM